MNINIRILTSEDSNIYRQMRLKSYQDAPLAFSESYEDEQNRAESDFGNELEAIGDPPEWFVLGAFGENNELIGFVKFRRDQRSKARHKSMIHAMYVEPAYRGKGIGKMLINGVLDRTAKIAGIEQIHLWVLHADSSVAGFYRQCGFESQGTMVKRDLKVGDIYVDAEYMVMYVNEQ